MTCPDTFAPSHVAEATREAGAVAERAEEKKKEKYSSLTRSHHMAPVAIETLGAFGPGAFQFLSDVGHRLRLVNFEVSSRAYLFQMVSVAVQRGNAASILGTSPFF